MCEAPLFDCEIDSEFKENLFDFVIILSQVGVRLKSVSIFLDKESILPGETLSGQITIRTSKPFECNRVVLKVVGKERTVHGSGEYQTTQEQYNITRAFRILEGGVLPEGVTRLPFSFTLPRRIPPSYKGFNGSIEYSVEAIIEVNWAADPRTKRSFNVLQERPRNTPIYHEIRPLTDKSGKLHVQLDSNILRMKQGIKMRFSVSERGRVRGVQVEIRRREEARCYQHVMKQDTILDHRYCPLTTDDFDTWKDVRMGEGWSYDMSFYGDLISVSYHLKVSLDVSFGFDPEIIIPLQILDEASIDDVLDAIESDLGWL